jgi:L-iditol 2-dehydrogenase
MKAARLYGARDVRVEDAPRPQPTPGLTLVRSRAVSICGSDLHYYQDGRIGDSLATRPLVLGHEFAGEVVEVGGAGPPGLRPGVAVAVDPAIPCATCEHCLAGNPNLCPQVRFAGTPPTDGGLQEYLVWPSHLLYPLPAGMDFLTGALLEPLGVAIHAVDLARVRLADTVAVLGTGSIGLLAVRLARLSGAARVFATDVRPDRLDAAVAQGAQEVVDALAEDAGPWLRGRTGGRGVDVAIECAGAPGGDGGGDGGGDAAGASSTVAQAVEAVRPGGTVVVVGIPPDDRVAFGAAAARRKGVTLKFCRRMKHVYGRAMALVEARMVDLPSLVSHRFPLADLGRAFEALDRGQPGLVKAAIDV